MVTNRTMVPPSTLRLLEGPRYGIPGMAGSAHGHLSASGWIVPAHHEGEEKHNCGADGEHLIGVDIGKQQRLVLHRLVDHPVRLMERIRGAGSRLDELPAERFRLVPKDMIIIRGVGR